MSNYRRISSPLLKAMGLGLAVLLSLILANTAGAAQPAVGLGTASSFGVLAGSTITNTGPSLITGDLGLSPGTAITGFPPGMVKGTTYAADAVAGQAQLDANIAYDDAAARNPATVISGDLGGRVLTPGVFKSASSLGLTGDITLDAQGDASAVFIFQAGSTLTTASSSRVLLANGADACNVFWQVGSSATIGTSSSFKGTVLALTSISVTTGATVDGRMFARNGAVTLDNDTITKGDCAALPPGSPAGSSPGGVPAAATGAAPEGAQGAPGSTSPSGGSSASPGTGTAILTTVPGQKPNRCTDGFRASVSGLHIKRVVFSLDGKKLVTRNRAPFAVSVPSKIGVHRLKARVTFTDTTKPASLNMRFRSCAVAARKVAHFTG